MDNNKKPSIAIIGVGNILMGDDGLGIHIARDLVDMVDPTRVEVIDGGTVPDIFTLVGENIEKLIIIDAVDAGDQPGSVYRFGMNDIESNTNAPVSLHEIGLAENLKIMELLNPKLKDVTVIGIQIADINAGTVLSREVLQKVPASIKLVLDEIEKPDKSSEVTQ